MHMMATCSVCPGCDLPVTNRHYNMPYSVAGAGYGSIRKVLGSCSPDKINLLNTRTWFICDGCLGTTWLWWTNPMPEPSESGVKTDEVGDVEGREVEV